MNFGEIRSIRTESQNPVEDAQDQDQTPPNDNNTTTGGSAGSKGGEPTSRNATPTDEELRLVDEAVDEAVDKLLDEISVNVGLEDLPEKEQAVARANYLHTGSLQVNSLDQADGEDGLATVLADEQQAQLEGVETNQHLTSPLLLSTVQAVPSPTVAPLHNLLPVVGGTAGTGGPSCL